MRKLYFISIIALMLLGIAHAALSFKKYESFSAEAFWIFSAGLALLFAGIANLMHYHLQLMLTFRYCNLINILLCIFTVLLAIKVPMLTTFLVAFFSVLLSISIRVKSKIA